MGWLSVSIYECIGRPCKKRERRAASGERLVASCWVVVTCTSFILIEVSLYGDRFLLAASPALAYAAVRPSIYSLCIFLRISMSKRCGSQSPRP